jgi:asparagine synthase (glutamine-hydrolysing)
MTGVFGGTITGRPLGEMRARLDHRPWYEQWTAEDDGIGLGLVHHGTDTNGTVVDESGVRGVVYGAISNLDELGETAAERVEAVLSNPRDALAPLDGPFALLASDPDDGRFVAATDKLGTRQLHYQTDHGVTVASEAKAVLPQVDDPTVDRQTLADLLTVGYVWNGKTLVEQIRRLPPATVLVADAEDGTVRTERYWKPDYEPAAPSRNYLADLATKYRNATQQMGTTLDGDVGVWLSGGLDSRSLVSCLADGGLADDARLTGYTYDSNPPSGGNPDLARRIGTEKGFPVEEIRVDGDDFAAAAGELVEATDGLHCLTSTLGVAAVYALDSTPDVLLEACGQGELLGERIWRPHIELASSPVDSIRRTEAATDPETASAVLPSDVDPMDTFKRAVSLSDETGLVPTVMDAHMQNHYTSGHFTGNSVTRQFTDTRTQFADTDFLSHVARLPVEYHLGSLPFTDGTVPEGTTVPKLDLIRSLDERLASIPYERTNLPPTQSHQLHTAGYVANKGSTVLKEYAGLQDTATMNVWYRTHDGVQAFFDRHLDAAAGRSFFDADAIQQWRSEQLDGENRLDHLAAVVTAEYWLDQYLD